MSPTRDARRGLPFLESPGAAAAMGAGQSVPEGGKAPTRGLHVLRVTPGSPASQTDIEPFFDFIVGYDDATRTAKSIEVHDFEHVVEEHEGMILQLIIWSSKGHNIRRKVLNTRSGNMI